jgi:hypothetical protein
MVGRDRDSRDSRVQEVGKKERRWIDELRSFPFGRASPYTTHLRKALTHGAAGGNEAPAAGFWNAKDVSFLWVDHPATQSIVSGVRQISVRHSSGTERCKQV